MMILLLSLLILMFDFSEFVGVIFYALMFVFFLMNFMNLGLDGFKGDLFGILGLDYISFFMVMLLLWLIGLILVVFFKKDLYYLIMIIMFSMLGVFLSSDLVYLFIFFECSMLPMFLLIMFWGVSKERYSASLYMLIYTMVSSLPMLLMLMILSNWVGGSSVSYLMYSSLNLDFWVSLIIIIMFLVKVPMFIIHIWLPKAHVEAPVYGSMILASVMLKLGGYGVIRCLDLCLLDEMIYDFFFCLCLCGGLLVSYSCLYQVDLKVLVAYSSIVHMGLMLMGFFSGVEMGYLSGVIMMLSHGICSSGLFYLVNEIYKISGSRLIMLNKGLMGGFPILGGMWFLILINNLGAPPCFGVLGELGLIMSCMSNFCYVYLFFFFIIFFTSCFVMNMYGLLIGGLFISRNISIYMMVYYSLVMHLIPLNFLIFFVCICL